MEISHRGKLETHAPVESVASEVFSNRRMLWMAGFASSSIAMFLASPGTGLSLALVVVLSVFLVLFVKNRMEQFLVSPLVGSMVGSALAAVMLWTSVLVGSTAAGLIGVTGIFLASLISLVSFVALIIAESVLAMVLQFYLAKDHDGASHIASMLDVKFAGLFGEIK